MAAFAFLALLLAVQASPQPRATPAPRAGSGASGPSAPTDWPFRRFSSDDYPAAALRAQQQGFVAYRLEIGPDGRVSNCSIRHSSGSAALDASTCRIVTRRSRFTPALDSAGRYVPDFRDGWVTWRLRGGEGEE